MAFTKAIKIAPDFYPPYINLGSVLERLGAGGEAVTTWYDLVNRLPSVIGDNVNYRTSALKQIGRVLERANFDAHAEDALRLSLDINSHQSDVVQHYVSLRQRQCKWPIIAPWANVDRKTLLSGISALSLAAYTDDPFYQLGNAYMYAPLQYRHNAGVHGMSHTHRQDSRPAPAPRAPRISLPFVGSARTRDRLSHQRGLRATRPRQGRGVCLLLRYQIAR